MAVRGSWTIPWRSPLEALLVALFPPRCAACGEPLAVRPSSGLCRVCFEVLEPNLGSRCPVCDLAASSDELCPTCSEGPQPFTRLRAAYVYGGGVADLVVAAKFRGREDLAAALGWLLAEDATARELAAGARCCVPVPLGARRRRRRGYNQSAVIARQLGRAWGLPVRHALRRTRETPPQSELTLAGRRSNLHGAFTHRLPLSGRVLLVDDVVTSGETVREAAGALRAAGAEEVVVVAVARATLG